MRAISALFFLAALLHARAAQIALPVYVEDNHAGSFYWLAQHLDLEERCTLLHFDAHSDASAVFDSDKIRVGLRRVDSLGARARLLRDWRGRGVVQCFGWIEPLMPAPIAKVIWIPPGKQAGAEEEAIAQLDGQLEIAPRSAGSLRSRYRVASLEALENDSALSGPLIASIDLDYFAGLSPNERSIEFERVWKFISKLPNLRAVTVAISRAYLADDGEAEALLELALRGALSCPTAQIFFEPFEAVANDRSLRAQEFRKQNLEVPAFNLAASSPALHALLLANQERIAVHRELDRWNKLLREWAGQAPAFHLSVKHHQPSTDGIWRMSVTEAAEIELGAIPWDAQFGRVQWFAQVPEYLRCNLTATTAEETAFARGAPARPRWREVALEASGSTFRIAALSQFFDEATGCGAVRIKARIAWENWIRETPAIEIRRFRGTGFRAALSEQFGLPYLFGSGALRLDGNTGPETGWGADCANFLIYALRRQGLRVAWSNPRQLRGQLEPIASNIAIEDAPHFTADEVQRGLVLHLGSHVAALMADRPPLGRLNAEDLVAHQLEGTPALITVGELLRSRKTSRFDLLRVPASSSKTDLLIGGDVMLGRTVGQAIEQGVDPFAGIREVLDGTKEKLINLECVISGMGMPEARKKFHLRAPIAAAAALRDAGITLAGLANNHANDFGAEGMRESRAQLQAAGLAVVGGDGEEVVHRDAAGRFVVVAINDVGPGALDRAALAEVLEKARGQARCLIAFVHWGEENTAIVTERQRELARWLIEHGVDLIAGSHPHCLQPLDFYHSRPIIYSLGNLVFDGAPTVASWNQGELLQIGLGENGPSVRLLPIALDRRGFPQVSEERKPEALAATEPDATPTAR